MIRRQKTGKWLTRHSREGYFDSGSDTKDQKEKSAKKSQDEKPWLFLFVQNIRAKKFVKNLEVYRSNLKKQKDYNHYQLF
jgi:hypothetical protein